MKYLASTDISAVKENSGPEGGGLSESFVTQPERPYQYGSSVLISLIGAKSLTFFVNTLALRRDAVAAIMQSSRGKPYLRSYSPAF